MPPLCLQAYALVTLRGPTERPKLAPSESRRAALNQRALPNYSVAGGVRTFAPAIDPARMAAGREQLKAGLDIARS